MGGRGTVKCCKQRCFLDGFFEGKGERLMEQEAEKPAEHC